MTNAVYPVTKKAMLDAMLALGTPKAYLIDAALYTYSVAHDFLADVAAGARVASVALTGVTTTDGVFDAADVSFTGLVAAPTMEAIIVAVDTGTDATSRVLCFIDTATGLPVAAGATQANVTWNNGASRIFAL